MIWRPTAPRRASPNQTYSPTASNADLVSLDRSTFGKDEVDALLQLSTPATIQAGFYVTADGFTPGDLGITAASLVGMPNVAPVVALNPTIAGMSVVPLCRLAADDPTLPNAIERFTWVYPGFLH